VGGTKGGEVCTSSGMLEMLIKSNSAWKSAYIIPTSVSDTRDKSPISSDVRLIVIFPLHSPTANAPIMTHTSPAIYYHRYTSNMESEPKCPSCTRAFTMSRLPLRLPCKHTVCGHCLSKAYASDSFHCPLCGASDHIPLDHLPVHRAIYQAMMKKLSSVCDDHRKKINWYCKECSKLLCGKCIAKHSGHAFVELADTQVVQMIAENVSAAEEKAKTGLTEMAQAKSSLVDTLQKLEFQRSKVLQGMSRRAKSIRAAIKALTKDSTRAVSALYAEAKACVTSHLSSVTEEVERRSEAYTDFASTASSIKALDICSQLKFVQKLAVLPAVEHYRFEEPPDRSEELEVLENKFVSELIDLLQEEVCTLSTTAELNEDPQ